MRPILHSKPEIVRSAAFPQQGLEFAECHFDGIQVGRVRRQIQERRTYRFNRLLNASDFMHREIVHDNDIAALERWSKTLLYIGKKHRPIHRAVKHERRRHPALAQTRHESDCLPVPMRRVADQTLASRTAASPPTIAVVVQVSSINTSRAGSNMPCSRIHRRRARVTSARLCSPAYRVF
jgi:hypothetical protein